MFANLKLVTRAGRRLLSGLTGLLLVMLAGLVGGCASYYNHYGVFPAVNASGEPRQVRVSWQSAEYPDWLWFDNRATPVTVATQCSERLWRLTDSAHSEARGNCGDGIRACGREGFDLLGNRRAGNDTLCMAITSVDAGSRVADLGGRIELTVFCRPEQVERQVDGEAENIDYLRASPVPYVIDVRKASRGSLAGRIPELDDGICEQ